MVMFSSCSQPISSADVTVISTVQLLPPAAAVIVALPTATAVAVAEAVASGEYDRGILICGTGLGVSIAANKVKGAYAALLSDIYSAKRARLSNDANIACMGAFTIGNKLREELTDAFLTNEFVPGCSSQPKVDAFREYEAAHQK